MTLRDAANRLFARIRKGNTLASYRDGIGPFLAIHGDRDAGDILPVDVRAYLGELSVSPATLYLRLSQLRMLFEEAQKGLRESGQSVAWENPCTFLSDDYARPKRRNLPVSDTIHDDMRTVQGSLRVKHRLIFDLGARAGMRISEILAVRPMDIIRNGSTCAVRVIEPKSGHNQSFRVIPEDLCRALWDYIDTRGIETGERIFPVSRQAIWQVFRARGVAPHDLRRYAAFRGMEQGLDLETLRGLLDHADVSTTARYIGQLSVSALAEKLKRM